MNGLTKWLSIFVLLIGSVAFGEVKSVITGPKEAPVGDLIVLDATQSVGTAFEWVTNGEGCLISKIGNKLAFTSNVPGKYFFVYVAAGEENKKTVISTSKHELSITGTAPVGPVVPVVDPTIPEGLFNISKLAYDWAKSTGDKVTALKVASNFTSIAAKIAAGALTEAEQIVVETANLNKTILGETSPQYKVWKDKFFAPLNVKLNELSTDKLSSVSDHQKCWEEIAIGVKAYGETK
jgi:hypothetical protein